MPRVSLAAPGAGGDAGVTLAHALGVKTRQAHREVKVKQTHLGLSPNASDSVQRIRWAPSRGTRGRQPDRSL